MIFPNKSVTWHDPVDAAKYLSDFDLRQMEFLLVDHHNSAEMWIIIAVL